MSFRVYWIDHIEQTENNSLPAQYNCVYVYTYVVRSWSDNVKSYYIEQRLLTKLKNQAQKLFYRILKFFHKVFIFEDLENCECL